MNQAKNQIYSRLSDMRKRNSDNLEKLTDKCSLTDYAHLVKTSEQDGITFSIWTDALQTALNENEIVVIPPSDEPYYIDKSVLVPSNRIIEAKGATVQQMKGVRVLLLRNVSTADGTHYPIPDSIVHDCNIAIHGGRWVESIDRRAGYGQTGMYDENRSFYGVSTLMLFNNMVGLTLTDITFVHTSGFSVQLGDIKDVVIDNIIFEECYADGFHINGNSENLSVTNVRGQVGDDLVALNMYDWQNSSVNFGPMKNVLCENIFSPEDNPYKAMRIEAGIYYYDDNSSVDCGLFNAIIKNVTGINTFKMYYQTPVYSISDGEPEKGDVGSGDYIFFEDINVDLTGPIDELEPYLTSDPIRGTIAAFEIGMNIAHMSLEGVDFKYYPEKFPMSFLCCAGPKSCIANFGNGEIEVFDPYVSCTVGELRLKDILINGTKPDDIKPYIREISFDNINGDGRSTGSGKIEKIIYEK